MAVDTKSLEYQGMEDDYSWDLITALLGGTKQMRAGGTTWLPQETKEESDDYTVRLNRSFLTNAFKDTINKATAKPFEKIATIKFDSDDVEKAMRPTIDDMDGKGTDFNQFAENYYQSGITWGLSHCHTDYSKKGVKIDETTGEERKRNAGDDKDDMLRPINRILYTPSVIGWKKEEGANGTPFISEVRIHEIIVRTISVEDGGDGWEEEEVDQIRVLRVDEYEIYQKAPKDAEYFLIEDESGSIDDKGLINEIPITTLYVDEMEDLMVAQPPFFELAWMNLKHWQSDSDQRNALRFARFNQVFVAGMKAKEIKAGLVFAPNRAGGSENEKASMSLIEGNGVGLKLGAEDIEHIEGQMQIMGWDVMAQRLANVKSNPQMAGEQKGVARIKMWVQATKKALEKVIILNAKWKGIELTADDFTINLFTDFTVGMFGSGDFKYIEQAASEGKLTDETYLSEMQRYDILSEDVNVEDEARDAKNQSVAGFDSIINPKPNENDIEVPEGQDVIDNNAGVKGITIADDIL